MYWAESFSQLGSGMLAGPNFLLQLAMQFSFFVVLLEKSWMSVQTVILSKGMRVSSKENSSSRGYALIGGPLYPGPQRAAREVSRLSCIYYVRVGDSSFCVCCCVEDLVFNFYMVFDVMFFVVCAVYMYLSGFFAFL